MEKIVSSSFEGMAEYLEHIGVLGPEAKVVWNAKADDVEGKHVFGSVPLHVAAHAAYVTDVSFEIPKSLRSVPLTLEQRIRYARPMRTFQVTEVDLEELDG